MTKGGLRWTEERYREDAAKRAKWQRGSAIVDTESTSGRAADDGKRPLPDHAGSAGPLTHTGRRFTLILPLPPSVNVLYGTTKTGAKFLTTEQREFRRDVMQIVHAVRKGDLPLAGRLEMQVQLYFANRRQSDIDNRLKATLDALAHGGAYFNDSQIDVLHVERVVRQGEREECAVVVREIAA